MYYKQSVILIIDDEYSFRKTTKVYLERCGYGALEAETGREGLALSLRHDIDLVLLHSSLPDIRGREVLQEIRLMLPELPVVVTFAEGQDSAEIAEVLRLGAIDYLQKPIVEPSILIHIVEKSLEYSRLSLENKKYKKKLVRQATEREKELKRLDKRFRNMVCSGQKFIRCTELDRRDAMILQEFADDLAATKGCMYHVEDDQLVLAARLHPGFPLPQKISFPLAESGPCAQVLRERETCMGQISSDTSFAPCACMSYTNNSFIIFPLLDHMGEVTSLLVLYDKVVDDRPALFQDYDLELGEILAYRVSDVRRRTDATSALKRSEEFVLQAQKRDAIATLAGGIAHDFNNILSAIVGYTDLSLFTEKCSEDVRNNLEQVQKASERARNLVRQILSLTRAETSEERVMELSEVILEALKLVRVSLPTSVRIDHDIGEGLGSVLANPDRIHQAVMNLCTNAAHAMKKSGGTLRVSYRKVELDTEPFDIDELSSRTSLCLSVVDDGVGIDQDLLEKIFDPYFTTKRQCEGTGLGLAVVRGIMDSLGGAIRVASKPGTGSTFYLYFPVAEDEQVQADSYLDSSLQLGAERVLFVDDEQTLAEMAGQMLTHLGYKPTVFTDSRLALEHFAENIGHYDLVITDLTMPFMSGLDLSRRVKELSPEVPVILHTGYSSMVDAGEARAMGVAALMVKPLTMSKLSRLVREVIDGNSRKYCRE